MTFSSLSEGIEVKPSNAATEAKIVNGSNGAVRESASAPLIEMSDEQLLITYQQTGRRDLFETLMRRYESEVFAYLRRYLGDSELAEDAFQTTFLQVHLKVDTFDQSRRFRPWLYAVATNQAIDTQRRAKRHRSTSLDAEFRTNGGTRSNLSETLEGNLPDPMVQAASAETSARVREAISELSEQSQAALQLIYFQGMKYSEAAEVLKVPVGTVKSRIHSAVRKLNEIWQRMH